MMKKVKAHAACCVKEHVPWNYYKISFLLNGREKFVSVPTNSVVTKLLVFSKFNVEEVTHIEEEVAKEKGIPIE